MKPESAATLQLARRPRAGWIALHPVELVRGPALRFMHPTGAMVLSSVDRTKSGLGGPHWRLAVTFRGNAADDGVLSLARADFSMEKAEEGLRIGIERHLWLAIPSGDSA